MSSHSTSLRRRVSFTPIMLTSKAICPVDRSDYELTRNERKVQQIKQNRDNLTNFIFRHRREPPSQDSFLDPTIPGEGADEEDESYRKLVRKMTTPTVVKVEFQKELIRNRRRVQLKMKEGEISEQTKSQINRALCLTNAKTFEEFTRMNKVKSASKKAASQSHNEQPAEDQWKKYIDKYYLSVRKVRPLLKNDDGMRLLSPQKIHQVHGEMQGRLGERSRESVQLMKKYQNNSPFRPTKRESQQARQRGGSTCEPSHSPEEEVRVQISPGVYKRIEQDVAAHRTQTRKDFFVFGMSDSTSKALEAPQLKAKIENYWDFIFRVNFTNNLYVCSRDEGERTLKFHVGFGNNSALIKGIMHRRFWWQLVDKPTEDTNFVWTQLKDSKLFKSQAKSQSVPQLHKRRAVLPPASATDPNLAIMRGEDLRCWQRYFQANARHEQKGFQSVLGKRAFQLLRGRKLELVESSSKIRTHNHLQCNYFLGNKKALFYSMRKYYELKGEDPFTRIPLTFHLTQGVEDPEFEQFLAVFQENNEQRKVDKEFKNIWIVKPGELTNRGRGITVCSTLDEIKIRLKTKERNSNGTARTFIIQKYIERPLLYQRRKFDIRHYMAVSCNNGRIKGYWYADGYVRTTSSDYSLKNTKDLFTHLTNDAVQKNGLDYGRFEKGNKLGYPEFRKYLARQGRAVDFYTDVLPRMRDLATDTLRATYSILDPDRKENNFELFGLDFMLDQQLNLYLIEVNTNPCLETSCPLLTKILTPLIQNLFKLCLDPLYPPPAEWPSQRKYMLGDNALEENRFALVFDECEEGQQLRELYRDEAKIDERMGDIFQEQEEYNDEEKEWNEEEEVVKK